MKLYLLMLVFLAQISRAAESGPASLAACHAKALVENCWIKPCSYSLDLDGDGKMDLATLVSVGKDGPKGIAFLLKGGRCLLAGAGHDVGSGGANFDWMDHWQVRTGYRKKRDGLAVTREDIGGVLHLHGTKIKWEQEGD